MRKIFAVIASLAVACGLAIAIPSFAATTAVTKTVVIWEENHPYSAVRGNGGMPYLNSLADQYGDVHLQNATHPSLPNYLNQTFGSTFGINDDAAPSAHPEPGPNIYTQVRDSLAFAESMPSNCAKSNGQQSDNGIDGAYAVRHNPWTYESDASRCSSADIPYKRSAPSSLTNAVNNGLGGFTSITPGICNELHAGAFCKMGSQNYYQRADGYLKWLVPLLQAGPDYKSGKLAIWVVFDEGSDTDNDTLATVISPATSKVKDSMSALDALRTWEDTAGVGTIRGSAGATSHYAKLYGGTAPAPSPTPTAPAPSPSPTPTAPVKSAPVVTTGAAHDITTTSAAVDCSVNTTAKTYAQYKPSTVSRWGKNATSTARKTGSGTITFQLSGLSNSTAYDYRCKASNSYGSSVGSVAHFTTGKSGGNPSPSPSSSPSPSASPSQSPSSGTLKSTAQGLLDRQGSPKVAAVKDFVINPSWATVEPAKGSFDFSSIDAALKQIPDSAKLRVEGGPTAPGWVLKDAGTFQVTDISQSSKQSKMTLPRFWTQAYIDDWTGLQRALAARYDGNPKIGVVTSNMCQMQFAEPYLRDARSSANTQALVNAGFTRSADDQCHADEMTIPLAAWQHTKIEITFNPYQAVDSSGNVKQDLQYTLDQMDTWKKLGGNQAELANYSLSASRITDKSYQPIYAKIAAYGGPSSIQTATNAKIGNPAQVLDYACKTLHVNSVELPSGYANWSGVNFGSYDQCLRGNRDPR